MLIGDKIYDVIGTWPENTKTAAFLGSLTLAATMPYLFSAMRV